MKANFLQAEHIGKLQLFLVDCQLCFDKGGRFRRVAAPLFYGGMRKLKSTKKAVPLEATGRVITSVMNVRFRSLSFALLVMPFGRL